ncbi:hypothetical protein DSM112329_00242 [Paraconexibacter sp. AEG42_29]|uniref:Uncharacterized protein n=2 Tax=Paraconexibacter sp. AEG42_29 TaxID=2997339 RepID=A0AAU7AP39_9ACTN
MAVALVAPALPEASSGTGVRVASVVSAVLLAAAVLAVSANSAPPLPTFLVVFLAVGIGMVALAFDATNARAAASLPEALLWATAGLLFARSFRQPTVAVAVALLVAGLALAGVAGDTSSLTGKASAGDPLTLELAAFGGGQALALPALLAVVLGAVACWTAMLELRVGWTAMLVLEAVALAAALRIDPVAPVLAAFLLPNLDRLAAGVRDESA